MVTPGPDRALAHQFAGALAVRKLSREGRRLRQCRFARHQLFSRVAAASRLGVHHPSGIRRARFRARRDSSSIVSLVRGRTSSLRPGEIGPCAYCGSNISKEATIGMITVKDKTADEANEPAAFMPTLEQESEVMGAAAVDRLLAVQLDPETMPSRSTWKFCATCCSAYRRPRTPRPGSYLHCPRIPRRA